MECSSGRGAGITEWCLPCARPSRAPQLTPELPGAGPAGWRFPHNPVFPAEREASGEGPPTVAGERSIHSAPPSWPECPQALGQKNYITNRRRPGRHCLSTCGTTVAGHESPVEKLGGKDKEWLVLVCPEPRPLAPSRDDRCICCRILTLPAGWALLTAS